MTLNIRIHICVYNAHQRAQFRDCLLRVAFRRMASSNWGRTSISGCPCFPPQRSLLWAACEDQHLVLSHNHRKIMSIACLCVIVCWDATIINSRNPPEKLIHECDSHLGVELWVRSSKEKRKGPRIISTRRIHVIFEEKDGTTRKYLQPQPNRRDGPALMSGASLDREVRLQRGSERKFVLRWTCNISVARNCEVL